MNEEKNQVGSADESSQPVPKEKTIAVEPEKTTNEQPQQTGANVPEVNEHTYEVMKEQDGAKEQNGSNGNRQTEWTNEQQSAPNVEEAQQQTYSTQQRQSQTNYQEPSYYDDVLTKDVQHKNNMAIASLVLGIVSVVLSLIPLLPYITAIIAIIFGIIGMKEGSNYRNLAIIGFILGIVTFFIKIGFWVFVIIGVLSESMYYY